MGRGGGVGPSDAPPLGGVEDRAYGTAIHVMDGRAMKDPTKIIIFGEVGKEGLLLLTKGGG